MIVNRIYNQVVNRQISTCFRRSFAQLGNGKVADKAMLKTHSQLLQCKSLAKSRTSNHTNSRKFITSVCALKDTVTITFFDRVGERREVQAALGATLMDVAKDNDIDGIEGACDGTLACSTCHCIFKEEDYNRLELEFASEDELDMLDLAYGVTDTSRLGCAIDVTEEMDGIEIIVPSTTVDMR